jgi:hypothetical protein
MNHYHILLAYMVLFTAQCIVAQDNAGPFIGLNKLQQQDKHYRVNPSKLIKKREPIVLVPGLGGSRLHATKKDVNNEPHWWCNKNANEYCIWMNVKEFVPLVSLECFLHDFQPHYDPETGLTYSTKGVTVEPYNFGTIDAVTHLEASNAQHSKYLEPLIEYLETAGYKANVNIRGVFMILDLDLQTF